MSEFAQRDSKEQGHLPGNSVDADFDSKSTKRLWTKAEIVG